MQKLLDEFARADHVEYVRLVAFFRRHREASEMPRWLGVALHFAGPLWKEGRRRDQRSVATRPASAANPTSMSARSSETRPASRRRWFHRQCRLPASRRAKAAEPPNAHKSARSLRCRRLVSGSPRHQCTAASRSPSHPSGVARIAFRRSPSGGGSRSLHVASMRPTAARSRRWVRS